MGPIEQYLYRVAPLAQGWYISVHIKANHGGFPGWAFSDFAGAIRQIEWARNSKCDVYLCMGGQKEPGPIKPGKKLPLSNRQIPNIVCLKSLRMDVDLKQYASVEEMDAAIDNFYRQTNIPKAPFAVKSGSGGYHLYWPFDTLVQPMDWQPLANALATAALSTGLKLDTECTVDRTRILRIPDTKNYKNPNAPTNVEIAYDDGGEFTFAELHTILGQWLTASSYNAGNRGDDNEWADEKAMQAGGNTSYTPADIELVRQECGFIDHTLNTGGADYSEKLWHTSIAICCHTTDPSTNADRVSQGYNGYTAQETAKKLAQAQRDRQARPGIGPPRCSAIEANGAPQCASCKHRLSGATPISFGYKRNGHTYSFRSWNDLPDGYRRGTDGKIWTDSISNVPTEQPVPICVFPFQIIPNSARLENGYPSYMLAFDTMEGKEIKSMRVSIEALNDPSTAGRALASSGYLIEYGKLTKRFFMAFLDKMREQSDTLIKIDPIGWHDKGFSFNGKHISPTGEYRCKTIDARLKYGVEGDDKAWRALSDIIVVRNRPDLCCLVATGFAAPLVTFTGHSGFLIGGTSGATGVGKTTALSLCQSIWGSPTVMNGLSDTVNHIIDKAATLRNLALIHDEIKDNEQATSFIKMVTYLTQGREKGRSNRDGSMRAVREWQTEIAYAANQSMISFAEHYSKGTAAIMVRMLEIDCGGPKTMDEFKVQRMVGALSSNYGSIGEQYAQYLGRNRDDVDRFVVATQDWFKNKIGYNEGERFWFGAAATLTAGSYLAKMLSFAPFEPMYIRDYLVEVIQNLRQRRKDFATDYTNKDAVVNDLSNFLKEHQAHNTVVTNILLATRGQPQKGKVKVMNNHPNQRWDKLQVHIGLDPLMLRFSSTALGTWCREQGIPKESLCEALMKLYGAVKGSAKLGSGTTFSQMTEQCFTIEVEGTALEKEIEWAEQYK